MNIVFSVTGSGGQRSEVKVEVSYTGYAESQAASTAGQK